MTIILGTVIKRNLGLLFGLLFLLLVTVGISLLPPQLLKIIIDKNLVPRSDNNLLSRAVCYLLALILIGITDILLGAILTVSGQKIVKQLRIELMRKLERVPSTYYSTHLTGEITSYLMNDVDSVNTLFSDGIMNMMVDCLKIIGIVVSISIFSVRLSFIVIVLIPIIYGITRLFQKRMLLAQTKNLEQLGLVNAHIAESVTNATMIKTYSKEAYMEKIYHRRLKDNYKTVEQVNFYDSIYSPIIQLIRAIVISAVILLASKQLNWLGISLGMVAASIELVSGLFGPIETLGMELQNIQKGLSGVKRLNEFYELKEDRAKDSCLTAEYFFEQTNLELTFDHVDFAYEEGQPIVTDFNLVIPKGTSVTLVGRTGIGKTTIFRLVMGLLTPTNGAIYLGGKDILLIPNSEKRKLFGYVEQRCSLIQGTIMEQITLKDDDISREQVIEAMKFVELHDYVMSQEMGYETLVTSNLLFSQGQLQLLSIARAIVANPAILLLDEITANMDSATEHKVVTVLQRAKNGRTVLTISHRKTAMMEADLVIEINNSKIKCKF